MIDVHNYEDEAGLILFCMIVALVVWPIVLPIMAGQFITGKLRAAWGRK